MLLTYLDRQRWGPVILPHNVACHCMFSSTAPCVHAQMPNHSLPLCCIAGNITPPKGCRM